ncbi:MAG: YeeE/YedE thiosulfate transporter family protein [Acidiphilium sp.]|nr:YeeE/YedE thiosulfate transporter family protein [Acidiphilium sp.]MDD4935087.1 YeeE/YedE thiosulfate transporter family protein [Acidiphilium sp.]
MRAVNPRPRWNPYLSGIALGVVLFATFFATGHGLGVTGATTAMTAVGVASVAPHAFGAHDYLAAYARSGLNSWIVWEVIGVIVGALAGSLLGRRFGPQIDGPPRVRSFGRLGLALLGGAASGFGARMAMGCTSGMGLSGSAPLAAAGFLFLIGFFAAGVAFGTIFKPLWQRKSIS